MNDRTWILDAAEEIHLQYDDGFFSEEIEKKVAEIIATCAEPLMAALREARREHEATCPKANPGYSYNIGEPCSCGADALNYRIDTVLTS